MHGYELKKRLTETLGSGQWRLLRLALPGAPPAGVRRRGQDRGGQGGARGGPSQRLPGRRAGGVAGSEGDTPEQPGQEGLWHHGPGSGHVRRAPRDREPVERRRPGLQSPPGLRPSPETRCPPRHAGTSTLLSPREETPAESAGRHGAATPTCAPSSSTITRPQNVISPGSSGSSPASGRTTTQTLTSPGRPEETTGAAAPQLPGRRPGTHQEDMTR